MGNRFVKVIKFLKATNRVASFLASVAGIVSTIILIIGLNKVIEIETQVKETTNSIKSIQDKNIEPYLFQKKLIPYPKLREKILPILKTSKKITIRE